MGVGMSGYGHVILIVDMRGDDDVQRWVWVWWIWIIEELREKPNATMLKIDN